MAAAQNATRPTDINSHQPQPAPCMYHTGSHPFERSRLSPSSTLDQVTAGIARNSPRASASNHGLPIPVDEWRTPREVTRSGRVRAGRRAVSDCGRYPVGMTLAGIPFGLAIDLTPRSPARRSRGVFGSVHLGRGFAVLVASVPAYLLVPAVFLGGPRGSSQARAAVTSRPRATAASAAAALRARARPPRERPSRLRSPGSCPPRRSRRARRPWSPAAAPLPRAHPR